MRSMSARNRTEKDNSFGRCLGAVCSCSGCPGGGATMSSHTPTHRQPVHPQFFSGGSIGQRASTRNTLVPCISRSQGRSRHPTPDIGWNGRFPPDDCSNGSSCCTPGPAGCNGLPGRNPRTIGNALEAQTDRSSRPEVVIMMMMMMIMMFCST